MVGTATSTEEKYQKYVEELLDRIKKDPENVNSTERVLAGRYQESQSRAHQLITQRDQIDKQVQYLQGQSKQLSSQVESELGKGAGILEAVVALKFAPGEDSPPEPKNRKARRTAASKGRKNQGPQPGAEDGTEAAK